MQPCCVGSCVRIALLFLWFAALACPAFDMRGYYVTFMRTPTLDLPAWKRTVDCVRADGGNTLLLWMGGAFPSKKFPITWKYNAAHLNVQKNFAGKLIDYAHEQKVKVILGFTPFAYDGVNQYPLEHPELKATQRSGEPANFWGMHSWGFNLCPAQEESQRFMLEYAREMVFEFYPNADGVLIESSDYAICYCARCREKYYENEFRFVRRFSDELWKAKPGVMIVVFPHYFSGAKVPGFDVSAAKLPFDPRWTLVFTPHSAHLDSALLKQAANSIAWDDAPTLGTPEKIRRAAQHAKQAGINGFVPSLEAFTFIPRPGEGGATQTDSGPLKPFGFEWLPDGAMPFNELLVRVNRIAYREFSRNPDLREADFKNIVARELLDHADALDDLVFLQDSWFFERTWYWASPITRPGNITKEQREKYRPRVERIREIERRWRDREPQLHRVAKFITDKWDAVAQR